MPLNRNMYKSNNYFYPTNIKPLNYNIFNNNNVGTGKKENKLNINFSYMEVINLLQWRKMKGKIQ